MTHHETAAKQVGTIIPPLTASLVLNQDALVMVLAVIGGLIFGGMWRAGSLASEGKNWSVIGRDAFISLLIGGANAILTLAVIKVLDLGVLLGMAAAAVIGATGVRALPEIRSALIGYAGRKVLGNDIALIMPKDPLLDEKARELRSRLDRDPPL